MGERRSLGAWAPGVLAALVAGLVTLNYTLNHFYVRGAYMLDSGWFAYLVTEARWPSPNPPALGGTYFTFHLSPVFWLLSAPWAALDSVGLAPPPAAWFALTQAAWVAVLAASTWALLAAAARPVTPRLRAAASAAAVLAAFSGATLGTVGFAHFEVAIPALGLAALALYVRGHSWWAWAPLALGLACREDAGLHYFGVLALLTLVALRRRRDPVWNRRARHFAAAAGVCAAYAVATLAVQRQAYPSDLDAFARIYAGDPAWAHASWSFVADRLGFVAAYRPALWIPLVAVLALAAAGRSWLMAVGPVSVLPWVAVSLAAVNDAAGHLTSHYAFPLVILTVWPAAAWALGDDATFAGRWSTGVGRVGVVAVIAAASVVTFPLSKGSHDRMPFRSMGFAWAGVMSERQQAARDLVDGPDRVPLVDDAVASLVPGDVDPGQWASLLDASPATLTGAASIAYLPPDDWRAAYARRSLEVARMSVTCPFEGTGFMVARRTPDAAACTPLR